MFIVRKSPFAIVNKRFRQSRLRVFRRTSFMARTRCITLRGNGCTPSVRCIYIYILYSYIISTLHTLYIFIYYIYYIYYTYYVYYIYLYINRAPIGGTSTIYMVRRRPPCRAYIRNTYVRVFPLFFLARFFSFQKYIFS